VVLKCQRGKIPKRLYGMEAECRQTMVLFGRMGFIMQAKFAQALKLLFGAGLWRMGAPRVYLMQQFQERGGDKLERASL